MQDMVTETTWPGRRRESKFAYLFSTTGTVEFARGVNNFSFSIGASTSGAVVRKGVVDFVRGVNDIVKTTRLVEHWRLFSCNSRPPSETHMSGPMIRQPSPRQITVGSSCHNNGR
jgi:hypothetical protein